jgi:hypothetical protein
MAGLLRLIARCALALLQVLHRFAQRVLRRLFRLQLGRLLAQLLFDVGNLDRDRRREARLLGFELLATLRELSERALVILAPRLDDADPLLLLRDSLLYLRRDGGGFLHRLVQRGERGLGGLFVGGRRFPSRKRLLQRSLCGRAVAG